MPYLVHRSSGSDQQKVSTRDILSNLIYADDVADLQERLVKWKEIFGKHGLRVSLEKTEVLWVG